MSYHGGFVFAIASLLVLRPMLCIRVGLFTGDVRHNPAPIVLRKYLHHAPVFINIRPPILPQSYKPATLKPPIPSRKPNLKPVEPQRIFFFNMPRHSLPNTPHKAAVYPVTRPVFSKTTTVDPCLLKAKLSVLDKLTQMQTSGSLNLEQFLRFRKLLLS